MADGKDALKVTYRPVTDADESWVRDTHRDGYMDVVTRQFGDFEPIRREHYFQRTWAEKSLRIVMQKGKPYGYTVIERHPDHIRIQELVLRPEFQGQGVGTQIVRELFQEAAEKRVPIKLNVLHENKAQELYGRLGFTPCGQSETHIFMEYAPK